MDQKIFDQAMGKAISVAIAGAGEKLVPVLKEQIIDHACELVTLTFQDEKFREQVKSLIKQKLLEAVHSLDMEKVRKYMTENMVNRCFNQEE